MEGKWQKQFALAVPAAIGESMMATPQLLKAGNVDYLVYDFLAEITMSIMARARANKPEMGYATDFITGVLKPNLQDIAAQGVKVLTNAGGVNPEAVVRRRALIAEQGLDLKVAVVLGDDLLAQGAELGAVGYSDMFSGEVFRKLKNLPALMPIWAVFRLLKRWMPVPILSLPDAV